MRYRFKLYGRDLKMTGPDGRPFSTATIAHVARLTRMLAKRSRSEPVRQQGADKISDTFEATKFNDVRACAYRRRPASGRSVALFRLLASTFSPPERQCVEPRRP